MGRREGLFKAEVAEILGVSSSSVENMSRDGRLRIKAFQGKRALYDEEEVHALHEARTRGCSPAQLLETAQQAWAAARVSQQRVEALERFLGLHMPPAVQMDEQSIREFHEETIAAQDRKVTSPEKLNYWADKLLGVCDVYLTRVQEVLGVEDPWKPYLDLSRALELWQDYEGVAFDPEEIIAHKRLRASREHLRRAVFTYLLQRYGKKRAFSMFPSEFAGPDHDILLYALASRNIS